MTPSRRWTLSIGLLALATTSILAAVGSWCCVPASGIRAAASTPLVNSAPAPSPAAGPIPSTAPTQAPSRSPGVRQRSLEARLQPLLFEPRLRAGVFGYDLGTGAFFDLGGGDPFAAASLIKVPIVVALLSQVDRGAIKLDESLAMEPAHVAAGSGSMQYLPIGTRFSIARLAELMIRRSDNTATNILIDRLGGIDRLNGLFQDWGLSRTRIRNLLPDMLGTNTTCPRDLVSILDQAVRGGMLQISTREMLLSWMRRTHVRSLLPAGVGRGSIVANKTGDIPGALGDAGYVEAPGGKRYLLAVQVERPRNSSKAKTLIRAVSKTVYESLTGLPGSAPATGYRRRARVASRRPDPRRPKTS